MRILAIGDVHGRADLLDALLSHLRKDSLRTSKPYRVIFLGDIIDRAPKVGGPWISSSQPSERFPEARCFVEIMKTLS
ncbi:metallophosphoesterase [Agrobacterium rhizogenes]|nr:metallophosphoesterase [Rhizobium rhizogenes]